MGGKGLDLEQAPPLSVPLRFFLTAPLFALLAALVALWQGPELFQSRWTPATLAVTHLLGLGTVTMVMLGALLQIMPVLAGAPVARPRAVALVVHAGLTLGTLALATGFLTGERGGFVAAAALLVPTFGVFIGAVIASLVRAGTASSTARMLRLAAAALAVTALLGACLAASRGLAFPLHVASLPDLHPGWALLGWVGLLVAAIAHRVVPMFQLTPDYPQWLWRRFGWIVFGALVAWSLATALDARAVAIAAAAALAILYAWFAVVTLRLQRRRRRRQRDVNLLFWRTAMLCAIAAVLAWFATELVPDVPPSVALLVGVLALVGAALSVVNGMLYRIVPFLAWFHLYSRAGASPYVPHLKDYLAESRQRRQLALHVASIALLAAAAAWPEALARAGAAVFAVSAMHWLANLLAIVRVYARHAAVLPAVAAAASH